MANLASIQNALQIFKTTNATKWAPKTNLKNATVSFEKIVEKNLDGKEYFAGIKKVVKRADGQELTGFFSPGGTLKETTQHTSGGKITTLFGKDVGMPNYKRVIVEDRGGNFMIQDYLHGKPAQTPYLRPKGEIVPKSFTFDDMFKSVQEPLAWCNMTIPR